MKIKNIKLLGLLFGTIAFFCFKPLILSSASAMEDNIDIINTTKFKNVDEYIKENLNSEPSQLNVITCLKDANFTDKDIYSYIAELENRDKDIWVNNAYKAAKNHANSPKIKKSAPCYYKLPHIFDRLINDGFTLEEIDSAIEKIKSDLEKNYKKEELAKQKKELEEFENHKEKISFYLNLIKTKYNILTYKKIKGFPSKKEFKQLISYEDMSLQILILKLFENELKVAWKYQAYETINMFYTLYYPYTKNIMNKYNLNNCYAKNGYDVEEWKFAVDLFLKKINPENTENTENTTKVMEDIKNFIKKNKDNTNLKKSKIKFIECLKTNNFNEKDIMKYIKKLDKNNDITVDKNFNFSSEWEHNAYESALTYLKDEHCFALLKQDLPIEKKLYYIFFLLLNDGFTLYEIKKSMKQIEDKFKNYIEYNTEDKDKDVAKMIKDLVKKNLHNININNWPSMFIDLLGEILNNFKGEIANILKNKDLYSNLSITSLIDLLVKIIDNNGKYKKFVGLFKEDANSHIKNIMVDVYENKNAQILHLAKIALIFIQNEATIFLKDQESYKQIMAAHEYYNNKKIYNEHLKNKACYDIFTLYKEYKKNEITPSGDTLTLKKYLFEKMENSGWDYRYINFAFDKLKEILKPLQTTGNEKCYEALKKHAEKYSYYDSIMKIIEEYKKKEIRESKNQTIGEYIKGKIIIEKDERIESLKKKLKDDGFTKEEIKYATDKMSTDSDYLESLKKSFKSSTEQPKLVKEDMKKIISRINREYDDEKKFEEDFSNFIDNNNLHIFGFTEKEIEDRIELMGDKFNLLKLESEIIFDNDMRSVCKDEFFKKINGGYSFWFDPSTIDKIESVLNKLKDDGFDKKYIVYTMAYIAKHIEVYRKYYEEKNKIKGDEIKRDEIKGDEIENNKKEEEKKVVLVQKNKRRGKGAREEIKAKKDEDKKTKSININNSCTTKRKKK